MTVPSVTVAVKEVSVTMGTNCEGVPPATAGTGKPAFDCKPDDQIGHSGSLPWEGMPDDLQGLSTGCFGGRNEGSKYKIVHSQVMRIRKEDHCLGEDDVRESLGGMEKVEFVHFSTRMDVLLYAQPILPSPLGTTAPMN